MNPERWRRVEELYNAALAQDSSQRQFYLREACGDDGDLRREVESLLEQGSQSLPHAEFTSDSTTLQPAPALALTVGTRLGPYHVLGLLGAGGMGTVYRAVDTRLDRAVAIKVSTERYSKRFEREARAISALNHPNICVLHDVGELPSGLGFMVTELVEGETLRDWLGRSPSLERRLEIGRQVLEALRSAHSAGIAHRDLKPANIMVRSDGYSKVLDFGLAKRIQTAQTDENPRDAATTAVSVSGQVVGTVPYMSPEQILGQDVDARSDLFAFGIILYEMIAGRHPWPRSSAVDTMHAILHDDIPPIETTFAGILDRLLRKNRDERYESAQDVLEALAIMRSSAAPRASDSKSGGDPRSLMHFATPDEIVAPSVSKYSTSVAVLAFTDMSAAKDQGWFCDGIAEEILNALALLNGLKVAARTSAFSFRGKNDDLRTIGEKLGVSTVLEGSVRRAGDQVRITVQLSDAGSGYQLWSERYDRGLRDIFDVQDEIARAVAERLKVTLGEREDTRLIEQGTRDLDAYEFCMKGRSLLDRRGADVRAGLDLLRKAVELDPGYSLAWASLADTFTVLAYSGAVRGAETKRQAMAAAARSIEISPRSAAGHTALACAVLLYENDRANAGREFERALEINPGYTTARCWYALHYLAWACGKFESSIAEARRAVEADPLSSYASVTLAACLCTAGRVDEAIEAAHRAGQQDPKSFVAQWILGVALGEAGRFEEAADKLEGAAQLSGRHTLALTASAAVLGQWGKSERAAKVYGEMLERAAESYIPKTHLAIAAQASGKREEAIGLVREAWNEREPSFILWARHFQQFRTMRDDPRFTAILREMDAPPVRSA